MAHTPMRNTVCVYGNCTKMDPQLLGDSIVDGVEAKSSYPCSLRPPTTWTSTTVRRGKLILLIPITDVCLLFPFSSITTPMCVKRPAVSWAGVRMNSWCTSRRRSPVFCFTSGEPHLSFERNLTWTSSTDLTSPSGSLSSDTQQWLARVLTVGERQCPWGWPVLQTVLKIIALHVLYDALFGADHESGLKMQSSKIYRPGGAFENFDLGHFFSNCWIARR